MGKLAWDGAGQQTLVKCFEANCVRSERPLYLVNTGGKKTIPDKRLFTS